MDCAFLCAGRGKTKLKQGLRTEETLDSYGAIILLVDVTQNLMHHDGQ
jgi:hypothetical protein